jgi:translation initiation factor 1
MGRGSDRRKRPVYSTEVGRTCPTCGWPIASCQCSSQLEQPVPDTITARLRLETARRRGKKVTVVEDLPRNSGFLKQLAKDLKKACGTGGTVADDRVEIQGDQRDTIRSLLQERGWTVKG